MAKLKVQIAALGIEAPEHATEMTHILVRHRVQGSTGFRTPRALGCSVPSAARALLRGRGVLNPVDPVDEASNWFRARTTIFIGRFKNLHSNEAFFT